MSVYLVKGKGWRYDFLSVGERYTGTWFKSKAAARGAEQDRRTELAKPKVPTDMAFLDLVNERLDHVRAYNSPRHYVEYRYRAKLWIEQWGRLACSQVRPDLIQSFVLRRSAVSNYTANKEIRYLRATFRFGLKRGWIRYDPTVTIDFLPVEKRPKWIPTQEEIASVIAGADRGTQDYLWAIHDTMARVSEINRLTWEDVDLKDRSLLLYTRKKRGGHLTPRSIPMTDRLQAIMSRRHMARRPDKPWVFWQVYWTRAGERKEGPYVDRKRIMATLCRKAGVRYFRFHALRHAGASILEQNGVPIGSIQKLLGHENRKTTETYLHTILGLEREAVALLERGTGTPRLPELTTGTVH